MKPKPACLRRLSLILYIFFCLVPALSAAPARKGLLNLLQPDGTTVQAYLAGDENGHLVLTPDGCSLMQDAEGWWCYARYDFYGHRLNTGEHAGDPDTPGEVIAASRHIPYNLIRQRRAARIRRATPLHREQLARTRSGENGSVSRVLVILAQFQDLSFSYSREDINRLLNGDSATSARSYFNAQWEGNRTFQFDLSNIVTLPESYAYYGKNGDDNFDLQPELMILDACKALEGTVDFSVYDNDGDGEVDRVFVFYAGPNEAELAGNNYVWPHQWYLVDAGHTYRTNGVLINNYACTSELTYDDRSHTSFTALASIGTFCHEFTHTFGIPDLYDTDEEEESISGYAEALWRSIDLMDAGNYNNDGKTPPNYSAVERWFFGMSDGTPLAKRDEEYTLSPVEKNGDFFYLQTDNPGEIYLFECRQNKGWDTHIGGSGLLIYHIDFSESVRDRWLSLNNVNNDPEHQCVDLIEPDPDARREYQKNRRNSDAILALASHAFWPFDDASAYSCDTDPAFTFWSGESSPLGLTRIRRNANGSVSFTVFNAQEDKAPAVKIDNQVVFQDASIIQWSSVDPSFTGNSIIRYGPDNYAAQLTEVEVRPYETGKYAFVIDGLKPSTAYKVQLLCRNGNIPGPANGNASFTTKSDKKAGSYPYIYLKDVERGMDGSFAPDAPIALRVYNAPDADGVSWYFDGKAIFPESDGYYHLTHSGELKAVISYPDSKDIITKKIVVK